MTRVLVVEDEESYREALSSGLGREGFEVELAADGPDGLARFTASPPDIVLLDLHLPGMHGTEVCRRMRQIAPVPIVMVSAVTEELDVVLGLELGAADYVTKPFRLRELVARMQAVLRRVAPPAGIRPVEPRPTQGPPGADPVDGDPPERRLGAALVDFSRREVTVAGEQIHLPRREFDLLAILLTPPGQVRTRDELIDQLWPDRSLTDSRTLDTHIHRLRTKLEPDPSVPRYIVTVRGVGFRIDIEGAPQAPVPPNPPDGSPGP